MFKILLVFALISLNQVVFAGEESGDIDSMATCLKAWGTHPFGKDPSYRTMPTSVKVFGIGSNPSDTQVTEKPVLIAINPAVNVMGSTTYQLLNPNGWYCFKSNVNVMGGFTIETDCKSHIAFASNGATVLASNKTDDVGVTVMGSTQVKTVHCD